MATLGKNFWQKLLKPIIALAPMADVTDAAYRQIITKYSRPFGPAVFYTEFVSADGLCHPEARQKLLRELYFIPDEQPIVAQIFSSNPAKIKIAAALIQDLGFVGLDINMGCPDKTIEKQGAGACLIKNPSLAQEIIYAAKEGAPNLPVSVKTRIGYRQAGELANWAQALLATKPAAIAWHLRTRQEMSKVSAHWDLIKIPLQLAKDSNTLTLGNGDVANVNEAKAKAVEFGLDGVLIGRGIFGQPWLWSDQTFDLEKRLLILVEHTKLFSDFYRPGDINQRLFSGHTKSFAVMKKHFKAYVNDFPGATSLRNQLMETNSSDEVAKIIKNFLISYQK